MTTVNTDNSLEEKASRYLKIEEEAWAKIKVTAPDDSMLHGIADDFLKMASDYFHDAKSFFEKGDYINCISAVNYSYGWIDAGVRMGILSGSGDHRLFVHYR